MKKHMRFTLTVLFFVLVQTMSAQVFRTLCNDGIKLIADRKYKEAAECFQKAAEEYSTEQEKTYAYANLAYSQQMCGELQKALKSYNHAIGNDRNKVALMSQRANILLQLDSLERALDEYNHILEKEPSNTGALFFRAGIYSETEKYEEAKADYIKLLSLEPDNANVKLGLAMLYKNENKLNESHTLLTLLIEENPERAEYYIARSNVERLMGYTELALLDVEKAIELEPENGNHYTLQAILYERLGKREAAKNSRINAAKYNNASIND